MHTRNTPDWIAPIRTVYDRILRPRLPQKIVVYGGVPVREGALLDLSDEDMDYKRGLLDAIRDVVNDGDDVVLVGGGRGVSSVVAARQGANVTAVEAAEDMLPRIEDTLRLNGVSDHVEINHQLVGDAVEIYGDLGGADVVAPSELSTGDVLVMDCEGAEASILDGLGDWPRVVVLETHPYHGAPTMQSREQLEAAGYRVETREHRPDDRSKHVLVGVKDD